MLWSLRLELESEPEQSLEKFLGLAFQVCTLAEYSPAQELGSLVWVCSLEFPLAQELRPRLQVEVVLLVESQGSGPLGASSLVSRWATPSKHRSCQVATDYRIPTGSCPTVWLVQAARPATLRGQELDPRQRQQQLKQQSTVSTLGPSPASRPPSCIL